MIRFRRKPVSSDFREKHELDVWSRYYSQTPWRKVYRASGKCSCGEKFGEADGDHTMDRAAVIEAHKDHVARAFHGDDYLCEAQR